MSEGRVILLPRSLVNHVFFTIPPSELISHHPWGCSIAIEEDFHSLNTSSNPGVLLVLGFVENCSNSSTNVADDMIGELLYSDSRPLDNVSCLMDGCHNCGLKQQMNPIANLSDPSGNLFSDIWVAFDWEMLPRLRRNSLARLLDDLMTSFNEQYAPSDASPKMTINQLMQLERLHLVNQFGPPLATLVNHLTQSPLAQVRSIPSTNESNHLCAYPLVERLRSLLTRIISRSATFKLVMFHMKNSGQTHRLRGLLPRSPVNDQLQKIDPIVIDATVRVAYKSAITGHNLPDMLRPHFCLADTGLTFLGAVQLVFLLLSLLAPFPTPTKQTEASSYFNGSTGGCWLPSPFEWDNAEGDQSYTIANTSRISWFTQGNKYAGVPQLDWFHVDTSEEENSANHTQSIVSVSMLEAIRNLSTVPADQCWFVTVDRWIEFFTRELTQVLFWLESGDPAGLKINLHLARLMGHFFLYHIIAWRAYTLIMLRVVALAIGLLQRLTEVHEVNTQFYSNLNTSICVLLGTVYLMASTIRARSKPGFPSRSNTSKRLILCTFISRMLRLAVALLATLAWDMIQLVSVHLSTFYIYTLRLLQFQIYSIAAAWRLCRNASKWNPLRNRVDTVPDMCWTDSCGTILHTNDKRSTHNVSSVVSHQDFHLDRLFVATLLGLAVGLCLLPTTLMFYVIFSSVRLSLYLFHR